MSLSDSMRIITLEEEIRALRGRGTQLSNLLHRIVIFLEEDDIEGAMGELNAAGFNTK